MPTSDPAWWHRTDDGIGLQVRATPGARRTEVMQVGPDHVRIRLAARPVEGQANAELMACIAELCDVRKSAVSLRRGGRSRLKTVDVVGIDEPPATLRDLAES